MKEAFLFDFADDEGDEDEDGEDDDDDEGEGEHFACNIVFALNTLLVLYKMSDLVLFQGKMMMKMMVMTMKVLVVMRMMRW